MEHLCHVAWHSPLLVFKPRLLRAGASTSAVLASWIFEMYVCDGNRACAAGIGRDLNQRPIPLANNLRVDGVDDCTTREELPERSHIGRVHRCGNDPWAVCILVGTSLCFEDDPDPAARQKSFDL